MTLELLAGLTAAACLFFLAVYAWRGRRRRVDVVDVFVYLLYGAVGLVALFVTLVVNDTTRTTLGPFVTSPGLGGLAAALAGGLALLGVLRQVSQTAHTSREERAERDRQHASALERQRSEHGDDMEHQRAAEWLAQFRWVSEQVLRTEDFADAPGMVSLIVGLTARAGNDQEAEEADELLELHRAKVDRLAQEPAPAKAAAAAPDEGPAPLPLDSGGRLRRLLRRRPRGGRAASEGATP